MLTKRSVYKACYAEARSRGLSGLDDERIMEIDHVETDGAKRRRAGENGGPYNWYRAMRKLGFPTLESQGLQLLCPNCHTLKTKGFLVREEVI